MHLWTRTSGAHSPAAKCVPTSQEHCASYGNLTVENDLIVWVDVTSRPGVCPASRRQTLMHKIRMEVTSMLGVLFWLMEADFGA